jgi:pilus assembly protein FimV
MIPPPLLSAASAVEANSRPPKPAPRPAPSAQAQRGDEPGFVDTLLESPYTLPALVALVLALGGLAFYRLRSRFKRHGSETSFLESRLQPDSFFGVSGGQRVDTRDAGNSSSMSYSLSQLDAIGDVDPVAEADVYLAYGRDLQAEEILKEAMRSNPNRLAIRTKLLEVYAKRRDTKGFELLATQLFALTRGAGEEWTKTQEMGRQIDAENTLYKPGGSPDGSESTVAIAAPVEPLNASTQAHSVAASATSAFPPSLDHQDATDSQLGVDLDLDFDFGGAPTEPAPVGQALDFSPPKDEGTPSQMSDLDFDLDMDAGHEPHAPTFEPLSPSGALRGTHPRVEPAPSFDLHSLSLDLDPPNIEFGAPEPAAAAPAYDHGGGIDFSDFSIAEPAADAPSSGGDDDQLVRKLELAEEFRHIGETEGARELLEEVLEKASGLLRSKAQAMLDSLD